MSLEYLGYIILGLASKSSPYIVSYLHHVIYSSHSGSRLKRHQKPFLFSQTLIHACIQYLSKGLTPLISELQYRPQATRTGLAKTWFLIGFKIIRGTRINTAKLCACQNEIQKKEKGLKPRWDPFSPQENI